MHQLSLGEVHARRNRHFIHWVCNIHWVLKLNLQHAAKVSMRARNAHGRQRRAGGGCNRRRTPAAAAQRPHGYRRLQATIASGCTHGYRRLPTAISTGRLQPTLPAAAPGFRVLANHSSIFGIAQTGRGASSSTTCSR